MLGMWESRLSRAGVSGTLGQSVPDKAMPAFLEAILKKAAAKKGLKGKRADRYTFGALNNMGAMRGSKITAEGERMQEKHDAKLTSVERLKA
jgi:hypothetical protein